MDFFVKKTYPGIPPYEKGQMQGPHVLNKINRERAESLDLMIRYV